MAAAGGRRGAIRHFSSIWLMGVSARGLGEVRKHTKRRRLFYTRRKMWPSYGDEFALLLGKCSSSAGKILVAKKKKKKKYCVNASSLCVCARTHWRPLLSESDSVALNLDLGADL